MIDQFKEWMLDIQNIALDAKRDAALAEGDESLWKRQIWRSPDKNSAIKARFRDEGEKLGYRSRPSYKTGAGEWLYDFVWRKFDDEGHLQEVVLAMEIEMSDTKMSWIMKDFTKLLQSDAPYKIFIFQLKTETDVSEAMEHFKQTAHRYKSKLPAEVLLCGWSTSLNRFLLTDFKLGSGALT
ncbi:hypothetical protein [Halomonas korlensis]|uniref:Uncharacterized protein n=1 Tax=Halomonas korlensis TaxID=463301 RepID=A0A1I7GJV3_9GAMM|nr:hypothetical protein [Halomonas korlensis]SFU48772.1 hypothetical protein SAMN04487955_10366 [Halomonas korlensis]